ncbi:hypothetical protein Scep_029433 [Stephania cephalantha]|uniref:Uncharacterized protein n=1 Tax=Stephania cephalantha TaxID=152367 RepID=A0AAP0HFL0_9MAGN
MVQDEDRIWMTRGEGINAACTINEEKCFLEMGIAFGNEDGSNSNVEVSTFGVENPSKSRYVLSTMEDDIRQSKGKRVMIETQKNMVDPMPIFRWEIGETYGGSSLEGEATELIERGTINIATDEITQVVVEKDVGIAFMEDCGITISRASSQRS